MSDWLQQSAQMRDAGRMGEAIDILEQAVAIGEESSEICKELARLSLTVNEVRAFSNWCHEAMRIDERDSEPHIMIGRVLVEQQRWEEAAEALLEALSRTIADPAERREVELMLGRATAEQSQFRRQNPGFSNI